MCWRYWRPLPETQFASRAAERFVRKLLPIKSIRNSFLGHLFIYLHHTGYSGISSLLFGDDFHWWGQRHLPVTLHTFISIRPPSSCGSPHCVISKFHLCIQDLTASPQEGPGRPARRPSGNRACLLLPASSLGSGNLYPISAANMFLDSWMTQRTVLGVRTLFLSIINGALPLHSQ